MVVRFRWAILGAVVLVSAAALAAFVETAPPAFRLALDPSSQPLFPVGETRAAYRKAVLDFGDDELYVVAMQTDDVFVAEELEVLRRLGREIVQLPGLLVFVYTEQSAYLS